ncbi:MAG: hypothetical protein AAF589_06675, partial [Planctomycetota bacterium]
MPRRRLLLTLVAVCAALAGFAVSAADMRIETRVYAAADEKEPVSESVTFFHDGVVYDFRAAESRVTIFRGAVGDKPARFLLLDTRLKQRTEVPVNRITAAMTKLRRWCAMQEDPFLRFTGDPSFEEYFDPDSGELRMTSDQLTYRLVTTPLKEEEIKLELRTFLDGFAQLHTLLESGLPPEPRLRVNEALFRHGVVPVQVEVTAGDDDKPSLRAEHVVDTVLSKS